jgi:MFS family permease
LDSSSLYVGHCRYILYIYKYLIQAFLLLSGSLSDIFGRKVFFIMGSTLGLVGSIVGATAKTTNQIIAFMAMMGVATAFTRYISRKHSLI